MRLEFSSFPPEHIYKVYAPAVLTLPDAVCYKANTVLPFFPIPETPCSCFITSQSPILYVHAAFLDTQNCFLLLAAKHPNTFIYYKNYRKSLIVSTGDISRAKTTDLERLFVAEKAE